LLQGWASSGFVRAVAGASLFGHFAAITRGVVDLRDVVYFVSIIVAFLAANAVLIGLKKAD
jgi:ABC-2 type transport system permease protein